MSGLKDTSQGAQNSAPRVESNGDQSLADTAREADPEFDKLLAAVKKHAPDAKLVRMEVDGKSIGRDLAWTARDEAERNVRLAAWKAAGSPEPPGASLPPMRGPMRPDYTKRRGKR